MTKIAISNRTRIALYSIVWLVPIAALGGTISACATSTIMRTEALSANEIKPPPAGQARIVASSKVAFFKDGYAQHFSCLDGRKLGGFFEALPSELTLTPGRHYLTVSVSFHVVTQNNSGGSAPLWIDVLPDHIYEVRTEASLRLPIFGASRFKTVLVDRATEKPVGGPVGSEALVSNAPPKCGSTP